MAEDNQEQNNFYIAIPKIVPLGIIFAVIIQFVSLVWFAASFLKEYQLFSNKIEAEITNIESDISNLKGDHVQSTEMKDQDRRIQDLYNKLFYLEGKLGQNLLQENKEKGKNYGQR